MTSVDIRAVLLPEPFVTGVVLLIARIVEANSADMRERKAQQLVRRLFGNELTFGRLQLLKEVDLQTAFVTVGAEPTSPVEVREICQLLQAITPATPLCNACHQIMLHNVGGKIVAYEPGSSCVACKNGTSHRVPMTLRKIAWSTGQLVEPQIRVDTRTLVGYDLPLVDEEIRRWCAGKIDRVLDERLDEAGLSLSLFLAYLYLVARTFEHVREAPLVLRSPGDYGLSSDELDSVILNALLYGNEREVRNEPRLTRRAFLVRRRDPRAPVWHLNGRPYIVEGKISRGERSDVYRVMSLHEPEEVLIVKRLHQVGEGYAYTRARAFLKQTASFNSGATSEYARRLHQLHEADRCVDENGVTESILALRDKAGYNWNGREVRELYPDGVPTHAIAWMGNRLFEELAWLHHCGWVHGAIVPEHLLVLPEDHMLTLIDLSYARPLGTRLYDERSFNHEPFFPYTCTRSAHRDQASRELDIVMACRVLIFLLGGDPATGEVPSDKRDAVSEFLVEYGGYVYGGRASTVSITDTKTQIHNPFIQAIRKAHGPSRYIPFHLPPR